MTVRTLTSHNLCFGLLLNPDSSARPDLGLAPHHKRLYEFRRTYRYNCTFHFKKTQKRQKSKGIESKTRTRTRTRTTRFMSEPCSRQNTNKKKARHVGYTIFTSISSSASRCRRSFSVSDSAERHLLSTGIF